MREAPSVILKPSHPLGPVLRLDTAGYSPGTGRVNVAVPLAVDKYTRTGRVSQYHDQAATQEIGLKK